MADDGPADPDPASPAEMAEALALLRKVRHYERLGVRMVLLSPGTPIRLRPVGQAVDLVVYGNMSLTK